MINPTQFLACLLAVVVFSMTSCGRKADIPHWPTIQDADKLVADIESEIAARMTSDVWPSESWPESVKRLKPYQVQRFGSNYVVIVVGVVPMDSSYGYLVFSATPPKNQIPNFGTITSTGHPKIWRFEQN